MNILEIEGLSKSFGSQKVIDNISLIVPKGAIFGFVGQNEAGKTTTMKMVLGLLQSDAGTVKICGETVIYGQTKTNRNVGYLPDVPEFYNYMNATEYLRLCGEIAGLTNKKINTRSNELLALVGLEGVKKRIGGYSRGMKQRLGIATALLSEPKLLICDEPTSALDPVGRKEILDILQEISTTTTVVFSSHILADVERICDHVAAIHHGRLIINGTLADIKNNGNSEDLLRMEFGSSKDKTKILRLLAQENIHPTSIEIVEPSLEEIFLEVVK